MHHLLVLFRMLQMQDMNILSPATLVSASLYTICTTHKGRRDCHFVDPSITFYFVSVRLPLGTETTPDTSYRRNSLQGITFTSMGQLRSHTKISDS